MNFANEYRMSPKDACIHRYTLGTCIYILKAFHKLKKDEIGNVLFDLFGQYVENKTYYPLYKSEGNTLYYWDTTKSTTIVYPINASAKTAIQRVCIYSVLLSILSNAYKQNKISVETYTELLDRFKFPNDTQAFKDSSKKRKLKNKNNNKRIKIIYTPMGCGKSSR